MGVEGKILVDAKKDEDEWVLSVRVDSDSWVFRKVMRLGLGYNRKQKKDILEKCVEEGNVNLKRTEALCEGHAVAVRQVYTGVSRFIDTVCKEVNCMEHGGMESNEHHRPLIITKCFNLGMSSKRTPQSPPSCLEHSLSAPNPSTPPNAT